MLRHSLRPLARLAQSSPAPSQASLPIRRLSLLASPTQSTSSLRLSALSSSPSHSQRRTVMLQAEPPAEEPDEPLEGEAVIDVTEPAIAVSPNQLQ